MTNPSLSGRGKARREPLLAVADSGGDNPPDA